MARRFFSQRFIFSTRRSRGLARSGLEVFLAAFYFFARRRRVFFSRGEAEDFLAVFSDSLRRCGEGTLGLLCFSPRRGEEFHAVARRFFSQRFIFPRGEAEDFLAVAWRFFSQRFLIPHGDAEVFFHAVRSREAKMRVCEINLRF